MGRLLKAMQRDLGYNESGKREFQLAAIQVLKKLRAELGLTAENCDVRWNAGGPAVSGEATLHGEDVYVQVYQSAGSADTRILYRSCAGRRDYSGGRNCFAEVESLEDVPAFARRLRAIINERRVPLVDRKSDDPLEN